MPANATPATNGLFHFPSLVLSNKNLPGVHTPTAWSGNAALAPLRGRRRLTATAGFRTRWAALYNRAVVACWCPGSRAGSSRWAAGTEVPSPEPEPGPRPCEDRVSGITRAAAAGLQVWAGKCEQYGGELSLSSGLCPGLSLQARGLRSLWGRPASLPRYHERLVGSRGMNPGEQHRCPPQSLRGSDMFEWWRRLCLISQPAGRPYSLAPTLYTGVWGFLSGEPRNGTKQEEGGK